MTDNALVDTGRPLGEHLLVATGKHKRVLHEARAALVQAHSLLGIVLGSRLVDLRARADPLLVAEARLEEAEARAGALEEAAALLGARWDKVPDRKRPHYTPEQRFRIVRLRRLLHLSVGDTARLFRVSPDTIYGWDREARRDPEKEAIGSLVEPTPPVRGYDDLTHHLVQAMAMLGFGGHLKIAECLANAGVRLHKRTVGRYRKLKPVPPPKSPAPPAEATDDPATQPTLVIARFVHHVWMTDLTTIPRLFGLRRFFVAAILDVYSRMPLAVEAYTSQPSAEQVARLLDKTVRRFGWPRHLVSDQGAQFTSRTFTNRLDGLGVRQRFGAVGQKGSIAIMERFWRTMKASLRLLPPLTQGDLEQRLEVALTHYAQFRPHTGLGGATPSTLFFADPPPHVTAVHPGRGRVGAPSTPLPVEIVTLDKQGRFPVLRKAA